MTKEVVLGNVMVDCKDAKAMQHFYHELLGWEARTIFNCHAVRSSNGIVFLFCEEPDYVPPVWPEQEGAMQKQMHFDFQVSDVQEAVKRAEELGAVKTTAQFGGDAQSGGEHFVTMLDPAGHPFCLCKA